MNLLDLVRSIPHRLLAGIGARPAEAPLPTPWGDNYHLPYGHPDMLEGPDEAADFPPALFAYTEEHTVPEPITDTTIYKVLASATRKSDHKRLAKELEIARDSVPHFDGSSDTLDAAFFWSDSAQGHVNWGNYADNLVVAGHGSVVSPNDAMLWVV